MTTTADVTENLTLAQIWQRLSVLTAEAWGQPIGVRVSPSLTHIEVEFPNNDRAAVDGAFNALAVVNRFPKFNTHVAVNRGGDDEKRPYGDFHGYCLSPLLPGVLLRLYCMVNVHADPWVHGDGFGLPPRGTCLCCGSRDCPMVVAR